MGGRELQGQQARVATIEEGKKKGSGRVGIEKKKKTKAGKKQLSSGASTWAIGRKAAMSPKRGKTSQENVWGAGIKKIQLGVKKAKRVKSQGAMLRRLFFETTWGRKRDLLGHRKERYTTRAKRGVRVWFSSNSIGTKPPQESQLEGNQGSRLGKGTDKASRKQGQTQRPTPKNKGQATWVAEGVQGPKKKRSDPYQKRGPSKGKAVWAALGQTEEPWS